MDDSIQPASGDADMSSDNVELPVSIDSLTIDGTNPEVGDNVDMKVSGTVTRVVNNVAYVKPTSINDTPLAATPIDPNPALPEGERLRRLSQMSDTSVGY